MPSSDSTAVSPYRKRSYRTIQILLLIWGIGLAFCTHVAFEGWQSRTDLEARAQEQALSMVRLIAEHASAVFQQANIVLEFLIEPLKSDDLNVETLTIERREQLQRWLIQGQNRTTGIIDISLLDANGQVLLSSLNAVPEDINAVDHTYFQTLKTQQDHALAISEAVQGHTSKKWGVMVARRIELPEQRFAGVLVANLGLDKNFSLFYSTLQFGSETVMSISDQQMRLLVRYPLAQNWIGHRTSVPQLDALIERGEVESIFFAVSPIDSIKRIVALRKLDHFPLYARVGISETDYLTHWSDDLHNTTLELVLLLTAYLFISGLVIYQGRIDQRLQDSEENFRVFFDSVNDFFFVLDEQGDILHVNYTVINRLGYKAHELVGQSALQVYSEEHHAEVARTMVEILAGKENHCPLPIQTKNGRLIPVETRVFRGKWSGRNVLFGVSRDISELKASEEKFAKAFKTNPALMAINAVDDGRFIEVNEVLLQTLGYTREAMIDKTPIELDLFVGGQLEYIIETLRQQKHLRNIAIQVHTRSGEIRHGLLSGDPIRLQDQTFLLSVMSDITEREQALDALRLSEQRLRQIIDLVPHFIFAKDINGYFILANQAIADAYEVTVDELLGKTDADFAKSMEEARSFCHDDLMMLESQTPKTISEEMIFDMQGQRRVLQTTKIPFTFSGTPQPAILGVSVDITSLKDAQQRLEQMAYYDILTGLPNRRLLEDRLHLAIAQAQRYKNLLAICYLDLDEFKPVNDTWGHAAGDALLVEVTERLKGCVRKIDTISRLGGDEFVLLLGGLRSDRECIKVLEHILGVMTEPFTVGENGIATISASLGVTLYPTDNVDPDTLIRHADQAMYAAKLAGRNRYYLFNTEQSHSEMPMN